MKYRKFIRIIYQPYNRYFLKSPDICQTMYTFDTVFIVLFESTCQSDYHPPCHHPKAVPSIFELCALLGFCFDIFHLAVHSVNIIREMLWIYESAYVLVCGLCRCHCFSTLQFDSKYYAFVIYYAVLWTPFRLSLLLFCCYFLLLLLFPQIFFLSINHSFRCFFVRLKHYDVTLYSVNLLQYSHML